VHRRLAPTSQLKVTVLNSVGLATVADAPRSFFWKYAANAW
jgi:hypothetical protein